jgi:hypothetical protein
MSYIDSFDHEFVGFFLGVPLYHPLQTVEDGGGSDFGCTPDQLVLGGGDGEHPAMILTDMGAAVKHFLAYALAMRDDDRPQRREESMPNVPETSRALLDDTPGSVDLLRFPGWTLADYVEFHRECLAASAPRPYSPDEHGLVEEWLVCSLGELVYFAMPEQVEGVLRDLQDVSAAVRTPYFCNVLIPPPGYRLPFGKVIDRAGDVMWGVSRFASQRRTEDSHGDQHETR